VPCQGPSVIAQRYLSTRIVVMPGPQYRGGLGQDSHTREGCDHAAEPSGLNRLPRCRHIAIATKCAGEGQRPPRSVCRTSTETSCCRILNLLIDRQNLKCKLRRCPSHLKPRPKRPKVQTDSTREGDLHACFKNDVWLASWEQRRGPGLPGASLALGALAVCTGHPPLSSCAVRIPITFSC
jgi:hypothetical protein